MYARGRVRTSEVEWKNPISCPKLKIDAATPVCHDVVVYYSECSDTGAVECCFNSAHTNTHPHIHTLSHALKHQPTSFLPILEVTCIISCAPAATFFFNKFYLRQKERWSSVEHINVESLNKAILTSKYQTQKIYSVTITRPTTPKN